MKIQLKGPDGKVSEFEVVPFAEEKESFSLYRPIVEEDHPLFGRMIKVKTVALRIHYGGETAEGEPVVNVMSQTLITVE